MAETLGRKVFMFLRFEEGGFVLSHGGCLMSGVCLNLIACWAWRELLGVKSMVFEVVFLFSGLR